MFFQNIVIRYLLFFICVKDKYFLTKLCVFISVYNKLLNKRYKFLKTKTFYKNYKKLCVPDSD